MKNGFLKVAAATPVVRVADTKANAEAHIALAQKAHGEGVRVLVFPELSLTGATCGDLFLHKTLLDGALAGLKTLVEEKNAKVLEVKEIKHGHRSYEERIKINNKCSDAVIIVTSNYK